MEIINKFGVKTKVFAKTFEDEAYKQIEELCNFEPYLHSKIRIMPDAHAGKGCTVGTTMTITNKITPNLVGVDIGCGMLTSKLKVKDINFAKLDEIIREYVPSGMSVRDVPITDFDFSELRCAKHVDLERANLSIGTLGGGNHFIEVNKDSQDNLYLVIHSGSRNLGVSVCKYYQNLAHKNMSKMNDVRTKLIAELKEQHREREIASELKKLQKPNINKELAFIEDKDFEDYIHDMNIVQKFAALNRKMIATVILNKMGFNILNQFDTIHNYIDTRKMILRKGAVSAEKGEILLIPISMRDGSLICRGKGNEDWNCSAPHGAGRLMSRTKAKEIISMEDYSESMKGIFSTSINPLTLDEAPQAYKSKEEIVNSIQDTVEIIDVIKPVYNFKAN